MDDSRKTVTAIGCRAPGIERSCLGRGSNVIGLSSIVSVKTVDRVTDCIDVHFSDKIYHSVTSEWPRSLISQSTLAS